MSSISISIMRDCGKEEETEFLDFAWEPIFTQDWATNAIWLYFLNKETGRMSDRWWQANDAIIDKERFDSAFTLFLSTYLKVQHEELMKSLK